MKYKKPTCDCGNELQISDVLTCIRPINYKGQAVGNSCLDAIRSITCTLYCPQCSRKYDVDTNRNNKIFRGSSLTK